MRQIDLLELADFNYWANRRLLAACEQLAPDQWTSTSTTGTRTLRGTLVHALDTEWSWRLRLQDPVVPGDGEDMREEDFPTVAALAEAWAADEAEMREWLSSLSDADVEQEVTVPWGREFVRWRLIVHLLSHSTQQRAEAATLLTQAGHSPGDIEFLNYISQAT
jgi:uncharacterized damage-inducible protein DinB